MTWQARPLPDSSGCCSPSTYPHTCKLACVQQPSTLTSLYLASYPSPSLPIPTTAKHTYTVRTAHLLESTALCYSRSVFSAPQALSMMRNGKRSDCYALLVSSVASALPVFKSCPSRCPLVACAVSARAFRGHRHAAEPHVPALLLSSWMDINTLYRLSEPSLPLLL